MDVDEAGDHCPAGAVDDLLRGAGVIGPEMDDAVAGKGEVDVAAIGVPAAPGVPGDDPVRVPDQCGRHRAPPDVVSGRKDCVVARAMTTEAPEGSPRTRDGGRGNAAVGEVVRDRVGIARGWRAVAADPRRND